MNLVFMGTPNFAVPALTALINSRHKVAAVYTKEPKPFGRGNRVTKTPIHTLAEDNNIKVYTPKNFKHQGDIEELKNLNADVIVVVAYGLLLPQAVLNAAKHGVVNIHPSKLPRWRGAAPVERAVMAGDKETAVCIMQMDEGLDTGDVLLEESYDIPENMTGSELAAYLSGRGAELLLKTLEKIENNSIQRKKQSEEGVTYAKKITKEEERIDWQQDVRSINNKVRALSPKPGAYFMYRNEKIKIITAEYSLSEVKAEPGIVLDDQLTIACKEGVIKPLLLQREGKKMVYTEAFLRGFSVHIGSKLE